MVKRKAGIAKPPVEQRRWSNDHRSGVRLDQRGEPVAFGQFVEYLPTLIGALIILVAGWLIARVVRSVGIRLGQDPAQSSSIVLTTITDIAGFFSFLGIATGFLGML